jgi:hypothetical protein
VDDKLLVCCFSCVAIFLFEVCDYKDPGTKLYAQTELAKWLADCVLW